MANGNKENYKPQALLALCRFRILWTKLQHQQGARPGMRCVTLTRALAFPRASCIRLLLCAAADDDGGGGAGGGGAGGGGGGWW